MRRLLLASMIVLGACERSIDAKALPPAPTASASAKVPSPTGPPPSRYETFAALLANADLPLSSGQHCDGVIGDDAGPAPTLGHWIAYNLSVLEDGTVTLPSKCVAAAGGWSCSVEFSVRNDTANMLWRWGVRFSLRADRTFDRTSMICIGSG